MRKWKIPILERAYKVTNKNWCDIFILNKKYCNYYVNAKKNNYRNATTRFMD